jgi:hypothetical protein
VSAEQSKLPRVIIEEQEDELASTLRSMQRLLVQHPVAAQSLFRALVVEGRRFATTAAGARWSERLRGSSLIFRGRALWEVATLNVLEDDEQAVLPSRLLDAFVQASGLEALEPFLSKLFEGQVGDR